MTELALGYQLSSVYDAALGGLLVTTFLNDSTNTLSTMDGGNGWAPGSADGLYYGFPGSNPGNAYVMIFVNTANPLAPSTQAQIDRLAYADCAPGGMMGATCMTGTTEVAYGRFGTMGGYPVSQTITMVPEPGSCLMVLSGLGIVEAHRSQAGRIELSPGGLRVVAAARRPSPRHRASDRFSAPTGIPSPLPPAAVITMSLAIFLAAMLAAASLRGIGTDDDARPAGRDAARSPLARPAGTPDPVGEDPAPPMLDPVTVTATKPADSSPTTIRLDEQDLASQRAAASDSARLLQDVPGVSLYGAGGISSLPAIHGMADDRVRVQVDGMDVTSSCPNHMNSPLSYISPSQVRSATVFAGITPVSVGGQQHRRHDPARVGPTRVRRRRG